MKKNVKGDGDRQGGLTCCDSWGRKESATTERLNWTELNWTERQTKLIKKIANKLVQNLVIKKIKITLFAVGFGGQ